MSLPETYLKTQQVADALGVSVSTIKRWIDAGDIQAIRTMGKHRLVALSSALKFARTEKYPVGNLLAIHAPIAESIPDTFLVDQLLDDLKSGRAAEVRHTIASVCKLDQGAVILADQLIRPALERIGQAWMVGSWEIFQEHQSVLILISALMEQIGKLSASTIPGQPLAIGAAPAGDPYLIPCLLGELVLRQGGWDVQNLSNNLPLRSLASAVRKHRPRLIFLSVSQVSDRDDFVRDYAYFYEAASQVGSAIILGGRALDHDLRSNLVYASFGERMVHLAEFARRLLSAIEANLGAAPN